MGTKKIQEFFRRWARRNWSAPSPNNKNVAIVFVSYNTIDLTAGLLFSLFRVLGRKNFYGIVVVDNDSKDGSRELLEHFSEHGMLDLIANRKQNYHGPAINQAIEFLAAKQRRLPLDQRIRYIWVIDSDVILLRSDTVRDAVDFLEKEQFAAAGQFQYDALAEGYAHISSLLIDPEKVWRRRIAPFDNSGAPAAKLQRTLRLRGMTVGNFPFRSEHYLLHLARGTLKSIHAQGDKTHLFYQWAATHAEHHYHGDSQGALIHTWFLDVFRREVPEITPDALLEACRRTEPISPPHLAVCDRQARLIIRTGIPPKAAAVSVKDDQ